MKQRLHIREDPNTPDAPYWVVGEGFYFTVHVENIEQAWLVARTAQIYYPDASIVDHTRRLDAVPVHSPTHKEDLRHKQP